jgi:hypothetical protein
MQLITSFIQIALLLAGVVCYILINRWQHKEIEYWKDRYWAERKNCTPIIRFFLEEMKTRYIIQEDYENAGKIREMIKTLNENDKG